MPVALGPAFDHRSNLKTSRRAPTHCVRTRATIMPANGEGDRVFQSTRTLCAPTNNRYNVAMVPATLAATTASCEHQNVTFCLCGSVIDTDPGHCCAQESSNMQRKLTHRTKCLQASSDRALPFTGAIYSFESALHDTRISSNVKDVCFPALHRSALERH